MRAIIQRVAKAALHIEGQQHASIKKGFVVLLGIGLSDTEEDVDWLAQKISQLRVFSDTNGQMNLSLLEVAGEILLVSQFTLHASTKKGNRPSFLGAAKPDIAIPLYEAMQVALVKYLGKPIATGIFGADMQVELINDGPVTIIIDSKNKE
jgi:D-aminoacyl-tRNA deacylase